MDWSPPSLQSPRRREQNFALIGAVLSGAVIAFGLLLLLVARVNPEAGSRIREAALDTIAPIWNVVRAPLDGGAALGNDAGDYLAAVTKLRVVTAERDAGRRAVETARALATENRQLKALMRVVEPRIRLVATARIAGASSAGTIRSAIISAGRDQGVRPGQPVRAAAGLVGRTLDTGARAARVLLLTDAASRVPVIIERTGQPALIVGTGGPLVEIRDRVGAEVPLQPGDRLVTSGDGGVFAPGVPVANVVRTAEPALARPAASLQGLGYVSIETPYLPLPPATATPAPVPPTPARPAVQPAARR